MFNEWYRAYGKRLLDFVISLFAIMLLWPIMLILSIVVKLKLGSPILFAQQRPGLHGEPFFMYKFRTMNDGRDSNGNLLPDNERLPPLGRFLRSTSLDELPELFNVLKGDMSLVGPRPLLMEYLERYTPEQMRRQEIRPGITGWAQINGRNAISWEEKFNFDVWYVDHLNIVLDIRIMFLTILRVLKRDGIHQDGQATMSEFMGTE